MNTEIEAELLALVNCFGGDYNSDIFKKILLMTHSINDVVEKSLILPPKVTTETIIAEISGIQFNENNIDVEHMQNAIEYAHEQCDMSELEEVETKRFILEFEDVKVVKCDLLYVKKLGKRPMNSSMLFTFRSKVDNKKEYHLRIFRNGKIQIPGVAHSKGHYEIKLFISKISECLSRLLDQELYRCVNFHIVMTNYKSIINLRNGLKIDVLKMIPHFHDNIGTIFGDQYKLVESSQVRGRPVLHLKFQIDKLLFEYERENIFSTSRKRKIKTITIELMESGKLLLEGCVQDDFINFNILLAIETALEECIQEFIVSA